ncbi:GNAT family N-acetyltransferase [Aliiroseovarius sp. 2305UL8-7]|uniref:GNAT family N-acetyltransferase n=1 Tax=Aliiroseovarius conchicola TaxID=3121637 RepID=UPI003528977E
MADDVTPSFDHIWLNDPKAVMALEAEWEVLANETHTDIYLTPGWFKVWWRHFGKNRLLKCLVMRDRGKLVGVLPFSIERLWAGPVPVTLARLAGTDPHCLIFRLPILKHAQSTIWNTACRDLLTNDGIDAISLTPVSELSEMLPPAISIDPSIADRIDKPAGAHTVFELPADFDDYMTKLSKKRRSQYRRDVKGLETAFDMKTETTVPNAQDFRDFIEFHNIQWQAVGKGGHFHDWPGSSAFYPDLADTLKDKKQVQFHSQTGKSGPLAAQFALVCGGTCHWRLPARSLDDTADKLSIGKVGLVQMIKAMIEQGVTRVEGGMGTYPYKLSYGGQMVDVHQIILSRPTASTRRRLKLVLAWSEAFNFLYYRLWFIKLAPRIRARTGMKFHALSRHWIKTRI